jgi:hypothetical protein
MLHCAVVSSIRVHGESSRVGSERSLDSPEKCSIGFQPVFFRTIERRFQVSIAHPGCGQRPGFQPLRNPPK